jgi:hypothetical protein
MNRYSFLRSSFLVVVRWGVFSLFPVLVWAADLKQGGCVERQIRGHELLYYDATVQGGAPASISILGAGNTDLDIWVYDEEGHLVGSGTSVSDREQVSWTPRSAGQFRIKVRNLGNEVDLFRLCGS